MKSGLRVLLVEDSEDDALLVLRALARGGYRTTHRRVESREEMASALAEGAWDVVLADHALPRFSAPAALASLQATGLDIPFLGGSGAIGEERAAELIRAGAHDYVSKANLARLCPAIERELGDAAERFARRQAQSELAEREAHLSTVLESVADGIVVFDEGGRIESCNRAAESIFGLAAGEAVGLPFSTLVASAPSSRWTPGAGFEARTGRRIDGSTFDLEMTVSPMGSGPPGRSIAIARDVTERNRMARQLAEQKSLAQLGEMAAVVAHEVKNPLAGIKGAIEVISRRLPANHKDQRVIGQILERIDALDQTVRELLLFARPRVPQKSRIPILLLVTDTVSLLRNDPEFASIDVEVGGDDVVAEVDADMLKTACLNVLLNAAQAVDGAGRIGVHVARSGEGFEIVLSDSGPGIPPHVRERLFEPFLTTKSSGTGLGLPTVRRVVEAHGGTVAIECPPSGGTLVRIALPLR